MSPLTSRTIVLDATGAPTLIDIDPETVRQVMTNLINNAARSDVEGSRIEVRLWWADDEAIIAVSDGGTGMTEQQRDRLFTRFSSGQPLGNGTGIGLYISQQLVELHDGRLFVDTLTAKERPSCSPFPRDRAMADAPLAFVVDDEPDMRDIISFALETHGFRTQLFGSAEKAWTELQRRVPDLLVIDVMLPGASGITLCTRVKALWRVPVMLVTARSETADRIQGFEAEADDYVGKPFHPRELALRAQRLVRWNDDASGATREWGAIRLEPALSEVIVDGARLRVTTTEFALLNALVGARGATVDYPQLLLAAWVRPSSTAAATCSKPPSTACATSLMARAQEPVM